MYHPTELDTQTFLAQGIGLGIAQGMLYVPTLAVISHYFCQRRTLAMSLVASRPSLGAMVHLIMLNSLFNHSVGFANGVRISATFISVLLLIAVFLYARGWSHLEILQLTCPSEGVSSTTHHFASCVLGRCLSLSHGRSQVILAIWQFFMLQHRILFPVFFTCSWILSNMETRRRFRSILYAICYRYLDHSY